MAVVKYGALLTEVKGKAGGTIFQGGRSGGTMRNYGKAKRSVSQVQNEKKIELSGISGVWRTLDLAQQIAWRNLASTLTRVNRFGDPYNPTGYQIFMEFNLNFRTISNPTVLLNPPVIVSEPIADNWVLTIDIGTSTIRPSWNYISGDSDWTVAVFCFWNQSNGVTQARGKQTDNLATDSINAGNVDCWTTFQKMEVDLSLGLSQLAVTIRIVNKTTGQAMAPFQLIARIA